MPIAPVKTIEERFYSGWSVAIGPSIELLRMLHKKQVEIVTFVTKNDNLIVCPYILQEKNIRIRRNWLYSDGYPERKFIYAQINVLYVEDSSRSNKIYKMLLENEINFSECIIDCFQGDWREALWFEGANIPEEINGYSSIDLSIYYLYLLNIYKTRSDLLRNIYDVNLSKDIFSNDVSHSVAEPIAKIVAKAFGVTTRDMSISGSFIARDIAKLIKIDIEENAQPGKNNGLSFENKCKDELLLADYDVKITPSTGDYGADILAYKDGLSYAIQCKDKAKPVGLKAVQEAVAARAHYAVDHAVVCATGGFTDAAIELATSNKVILCISGQLASRLS